MKNIQVNLCQDISEIRNVNLLSEYPFVALWAVSLCVCLYMYMCVCVCVVLFCVHVSSCLFSLFRAVLAQCGCFNRAAKGLQMKMSSKLNLVYQMVTFMFNVVRGPLQK